MESSWRPRAYEPAQGGSDGPGRVSTGLVESDEEDWVEPPSPPDLDARGLPVARDDADADLRRALRPRVERLARRTDRAVAAIVGERVESSSGSESESGSGSESGGDGGGDNDGGGDVGGEGAHK